MVHAILLGLGFNYLFKMSSSSESRGKFKDKVWGPTLRVTIWDTVIQSAGHFRDPL